MHLLTKDEFEQVAKPLLHQIFVSNDETEPFAEQVQERLLLFFPIGGDPNKNYFSKRQLAAAIAFAARSTEESGCYLLTGWLLRFLDPMENYYTYIPIPELEDALAAPPGSSKSVWTQLNMSKWLGYCLFSEQGSWALYVTIDDYGFLGGSSEFMQFVRQSFLGIEKQVVEWLCELKLEQMDGEKIDTEWLTQILTHVYGEETARTLLVDAKLIVM